MTSAFNHHPVRLRRSVLCLPASNARAIAKLGELQADAIIFDLEDSVAEESKEEARQNIRNFLANHRDSGREIIIRINEKSSSHYDKDLALVLECEPDAVLLTKVRAQDDVLEVSLHLSENDAPETVRIWAMMETPLAILNAGSIAEAGRTAGGRLDCFVVGLNDLRKDTGVALDPARMFLVPWLMQVILAGRAFGLTVIDSVSNDISELAPFEAECMQGRAMGFDGKMVIHPVQIEAPNRLFQPSEAEVSAALAIIAAFEKPENAALNAISIDGRMVERLHYQQAQKLAAKSHQMKARTSKA